VVLDIFHLLGPTTIIHPERFSLAFARNLVKTGLGEGGTPSSIRCGVGRAKLGVAFE